MVDRDAGRGGLYRMLEIVYLRRAARERSRADATGQPGVHRHRVGHPHPAAHPHPLAARRARRA